MIRFGNDARAKLLLGSSILNDAVKVTLGAKGKNVIIKYSKGAPPKITKDGVTVAGYVQHDDPVVSMGIEIMQQAASSSMNGVGDGPQPLYAKVLTPTGFVEMGALKVGDEICGTNGSVQSVLGVFLKGEKEIFEVTTFDGRKTECCEDHLWFFTTRDGVKKTMSLRQILDSGCFGKKTALGYNNRWAYLPDTFVDFTDKSHYLSPYLIGVLIGDGSLKGPRSIELSIGKTKKHIIDKIELPEGINMNVRYVESRNYYRIKFVGQSEDGRFLKDYLNELGLLGVTSDTKFIPKDYLFDSLPNRLKLMEGLTDTDGHNNSRGLIEYSTVSKQLAEDYVALGRSLGNQYRTNLHQRKGDSYSNKPIYRIGQMGGCKHGIAIVDIRKTGKTTQMQCIKVSNPDSLYITDDFIVTHNTTTSVVLAHAMAAAAMKRKWYERFLSVNTVEVKDGMDAAVNALCAYIDKQKVDVKYSKNLLKQVATISANGDSEIGELVADIVVKTGDTGSIDIRSSGTPFTTSYISDGVKIDAGLKDPVFVTNGSKGSCELDNPYVLIAMDTLETQDHVRDILLHCSQNQRPLIVVAKSVTKEALNMLTINHIKNSVRCGIIIIPEISSIGELILDDLCIATGATMYKRQRGPIRVTPDLLGSCDRAIVDAHEGFLINGAGKELAIATRIGELKAQLENASDHHAKMVLQARLARISGKAGVIEVGGATEAEMSEKKDRIDDAVHAAKAAAIDGVVAGGGVCLASAKSALYPIRNPHASASFIKGVDIVESALTAPMKTILANAGYHMIHSDGKIGIDVTTGDFVDMIESGIIDPAKVTKTALKSAVSVASVLLTTECAIEYEVKREAKN